MIYITESQAESQINGLLNIDLQAFTKQCPPERVNDKCEPPDGYYQVDRKFEGQTISIYQTDGLEDSYKLVIYFPGCVNAHVVYKSGKEADLKIDHSKVFDKKTLDINLSDPLDLIQVNLLRDWVPPRVYNVRFILADAERIKKNQDKKNRESLIEKMKVEAKAGDQLINVFFEPASDNVTKTVLKLYLCSNSSREDNSRLIGQFEPSPGTYFISVNNLVPGTYGYKLIQYLSDDDEPLVSAFKTIQVYSGDGGGFSLTY